MGEPIVELLSAGEKLNVAVMWQETALAERLLYKSRSQHRRSRHFRLLRKVLRKFNLLRMLACPHPLAKISSARRQMNQNEFEEHLLKIGDGTLHDLKGILHQILQTEATLLHAASEVAMLLAQAFFLPFAVTVLACLSRLHTLLLQLLKDATAAFDLLCRLPLGPEKEPLEVRLMAKKEKYAKGVPIECKASAFGTGDAKICTPMATVYPEAESCIPGEVCTTINLFQAGDFTERSEDQSTVVLASGKHETNQGTADMLVANLEPCNPWNESILEDAKEASSDAKHHKVSLAGTKRGASSMVEETTSPRTWSKFTKTRLNSYKTVPKSLGSDQLFSLLTNSERDY